MIYNNSDIDSSISYYDDDDDDDGDGDGDGDGDKLITKQQA